MARDLPRAAASYRRAVALDPKGPGAHHGLGNTLSQQGDQRGAIASFRRALALVPKAAGTHHSLARALWLQGDLAGAAACYRRVVQLRPKYADVHYNLGHVLLRQGDPRAALTALQTGHDLGSRRKDWPYPSAQWVRQCQRFIELEDRLPAILKGEDRPAGAAERIELAELCGYKGLHVSSVRLFAEAFDADATLADNLGAGHRFHAACSAAQAGCGEGVDAAPDEKRAGLRKQALEWLRADLAGRARRLEGGTPQDRVQVRTMLLIWQGHFALAGVRDAGRLAALPSAERAEWQKLWADIAATRALARDGK
jgi:eukaryotic-like serine/threonine-protein kinase